MRIGVAYLRMSTDKQEFSIDSQLRLINDFAKKNNILIKKNYMDEGISGRNAEKRPGFMQMINDSSNLLFDCVLIYDSSRFARNLEQSIVYKAELKRNGVELISITEPIVDDDTALITDALLGAMNEMYSRKLSKNVKRGMEQKALRGEYLSCAPFGYDRVISGKPLQINEKESRIIRLIFKKYLNGCSCFAIARELNDLGIKTKKNNPINKRFIQHVLSNVTYKGYLSWTSNEKTIYKKANHKPIIDEITFEKVQVKLNNNKNMYKHKSRPAETYKHWLIGFLKCSVCGKGYIYGKGYNGRSDRFKCGGYVNATCKQPSSIRVIDMEEIVLNELTYILKDSSINYTISMEQVPDIDTKSINKEISLLNKNLKRAKEAYLQGIDDIGEYKYNKLILKKKLDELLYKKNQLNNRILSTNNYTTNLNDLLNDLKGNSTVSQKFKIAKTLIEKVAFDAKNKEVTIYFLD